MKRWVGVGSLLGVAFFLVFCTGRQKRIELQPNGQNSNIAFSDDGERLAYKGVRGTKSFVVVWDGARLKEGKGYDEVEDIFFGPDGGKLFYVAKEGEKYRLVVDGKEGPAYDSLNIFPDTAVSSQGGKVAYIASLNTGDPKVYFDDRDMVVVGDQEQPYDADLLSPPHWSQDGKVLAYVGEQSRGVYEPSKRFVVLNGQKGRTYDEIVGIPVFRPGSIQIAYIAGLNGRRFLVVGTQEGQAHKNVFPPLFSADGNKMVYLVKEDEGYFAIADGREGKHYGTVNTDSLIMTADGKKVAYIAGEPAALGVWKHFVVENGQEGPAYENIDHLTLSSDGQRAAYIAKRGEKSFVVLDGKEGNGYHSIGELPPSFSPDNRHLAYIAIDQGGQRIVIDGQEGPLFEEIEDYAWSPKGSRLAYRGKRNGGSFLVIDGKENGPYQEVSPAVFSPDSKNAAYWAGRDNKAFLVFDGHEGKPYEEIHHLRFSPDGKHLLYVASIGRQLSLLLDERELQSLEGIGDFGTPEKYIKPDSVKTWRIAAGELKAFIAGEVFYLQLDSRTIYRENEPIAGGPRIEWLFRSPQWGDIFLLNIYEGDGCAEGRYQVMRITASGAENMSKEFGNCNESEIRQKGEAFRFSFPPREYLGRIYSSETWVYRNGSLKPITSAHPNRKTNGH